MRVRLLTYDERENGVPRSEPQLSADPRPFIDAQWEVVELEKATAVPRLIALSRTPADLYFNLCDGSWDSDAPGIEVVQTLERLGLPFTGATAHFYDPSREAMKRVCAAWGIDTPGYVIADGEEHVVRAMDTLSFPVIVKHPASYGSVGLTRESKVADASSLGRQAARVMEQYGAALIEEFIEGGEATVLVAEDGEGGTPIAYQPIRYRFPDGESFKHYDLKWEDYAGLHAESTDAELGEILRDLSVRMFRGLRGTGYGRCDFRIDRDGRPFFLEINPNCGIYYPQSDPGSADLCLLHDPAGHHGFTRTIVDAALRRHRLGGPAWEVRPTAPGQYGTFATRAVDPGETVVPFEERPHVLVTRSHVEATWSEARLSWFRRYAWPLTDEVWVTWAEDPEDWRPINHSCEPTAWLEGLDVVARVPLQPGSEVTLDYATFCTEPMPPFECSCGAPTCRGTIRGDDFLADFVDRYGRHISDHVRRRRAGGDPKR